MSKLLENLARRALTTFDVARTSITTSHLESAASQSFSALSVCTAALAQLVSDTKSGESVVLKEAARGCTVQLLDQMTATPDTEVLETKVTFRVFKILRSGPLFLSEQESLSLLEQLDRLTNAVAIGAWSPPRLLACLHAIAKGCPSAAPPSLTLDLLLRLEHSLPRLGPRETATVMWCMTVLRLYKTNTLLWRKVCRRVSALFATMDDVSRATVAHCAFIAPEGVTQELGQALYSAYVGKHGMGGGDPSDLFTTSSLPPREREIQRSLKIRMLTNAGASSADLLLAVVENALNNSGIFVEIDDDVRLTAHHLSRRRLTPNQCCRILLLSDTSVSPSYRLDSHNTYGFLYLHALKTLLAASCSPSSSHLSLPTTLLSLSTLLATTVRQAFLPFGVELDADTTRRVWDALLRAILEGVQVIQSNFNCPPGELTAALLAANATATCALTSAQLPPSVVAEAETATAKASALLRAAPAHWFRSSRPGLDGCTSFITSVCEYKEDLLLVAADGNALTRELFSTIGAEMPAHLPLLSFGRLLDLVYIAETAPRALRPLLAPLTEALLRQLELQRMSRRKILSELTGVIRRRTTGATAAAVPDSLFLIYIEALLSETNTAECPQHLTDLVVACLAQRADNAASLQTGFMKLMTRQLGQERCFFDAVPLGSATLVRLIDLASVLLAKNRPVGVSILSKLFELLSDSVEGKGHNLQALNEVASVFSSDICVELHMKDKLVRAVEKRAIALLSQPNTYSALDKAFLIAHFVSSRVPITEELHQALHLNCDGTGAA